MRVRDFLLRSVAAMRSGPAMAGAIQVAVVALLTTVLLEGVPDPRTAQRARNLASGITARTLDLGLRVYDPWQPVAPPPNCNCSSAIPFRCADPDSAYNRRVRSDPRLVWLRDVQPHRIESYAAMMDWLRSRFEHGAYSRPSDLSSAGFHLLEMLDAAERGERFLCGAVAKMMIQLVQAAGGFGRRVSLADPEGSGHVVTELWIEEPGEPGRWVVFDPDYNVWFSDASGRPLSALDLHRHAISGTAEEVTAHAGTSPNTLYAEPLHDLLLAHFDMVAWSSLANWASVELPSWHPRRHPIRRTWVWDNTRSILPSSYVRGIVSDAEEIYFTPCRDALDSAHLGGGSEAQSGYWMRSFPGRGTPWQVSTQPSAS